MSNFLQVSSSYRTKVYYIRICSGLVYNFENKVLFYAIQYKRSEGGQSEDRNRGKQDQNTTWKKNETEPKKNQLMFRQPLSQN